MPASAAYVCHYVGPMFGVSRFVMESGRCHHEYELSCGDATGIGLESGKLCKLIRENSKLCAIFLCSLEQSSVLMYISIFLLYIF